MGNKSRQHMTGMNLMQRIEDKKARVLNEARIVKAAIAMQFKDIKPAILMQTSEEIPQEKKEENPNPASGV
jgi:hypothetical protein